MSFAVIQLSPLAVAQDPTKEARVVKAAESTSQAIFESLMDAIRDDSYANFHAFGDADVKEHLTKDIFESVVEQVAPRMKKGYRTEYLGSMNKLGFKLHLWKISYEDGGDDMLCQMSLKQGKVGGFFLN